MESAFYSYTSRNTGQDMAENTHRLYKSFEEIVLI